MRVAVLSDIHGNLEALDAVLADMAGGVVDQVVCLGDLVGYGPDPEEVVSRVRREGYQAILGNHEAALAARNERERMNFQARENNISTAALLSAANLSYCCSLPRTFELGPALFVHGCPPDSVHCYLYLLPDEAVRRLLADDTGHRLYFVGHTHELMLVWLEDGQVVRRRLEQGVHDLGSDDRYLINCGSVGQPRDGDRRAKYLIWDSGQSRLEVRAVDYDAKVTAGKIIDRGFPKAFADRLC